MYFRNNLVKFLRLHYVGEKKFLLEFIKIVSKTLDFFPVYISLSGIFISTGFQFPHLASE